MPEGITKSVTLAPLEVWSTKGIFRNPHLGSSPSLISALEGQGRIGREARRWLISPFGRRQQRCSPPQPMTPPCAARLYIFAGLWLMEARAGTFWLAACLLGCTAK